MANEPSFLKVDRWILEGDAERLATLEGDAEWRGHLAEVRREPTVPAWVRNLRDDAPRPRRRPWWWGLAVVAATAIVLVVAWPRPSYVGVKSGGLEVTLYLEDGVWEGEPIAVGAPLRLRLHGPAAPYYAVLLEERGEATVVSAGPWPAGGTVPGAWAFDVPPAEDASIVVLSLPIDPAGLPVEVLRREARETHRQPLVRPR